MRWAWVDRGGVMQRRHFDGVMFDLDGTLVQTDQEIADAVNDTLASQNLPGVAQVQVARWIGQGTRELLVQALASARQETVAAVRASALLPALVAEFDRHYARRCGTSSQLYPQVREVLTDLQAKGVRLALVTNKEARFTHRVLQAHGLAEHFEHVISGDTLPSKKPDPAGIALCLAAWQLPAQRALFVGDSSIDVATARRAGVPVWVLPYGYNMGQPIADCGPDRVIDTLAALLEGSALS